MRASELARFAIPGALRFEDGGNGLTRALIATPQTESEIYLHGAPVTRWIPRAQRPILFTSSHSFFAPGKPIRGGVPLVFPWFVPRPSGRHGDHPESSDGCNSWSRMATARFQEAMGPADPTLSDDAGLKIGITTNACR